MLELDLRTVVVVSAITSALMSLVLCSLWRSYPSTIRGLGEWAAAPALLSVAAALFAGRGVLADGVSILLANLLLLGGGVLIYLGVQRFFDIAPSRRLGAALLLAAGALIVWFTWVQPHYGARVVLVTLFLSGVALGSVVLLLRKGHRSFPAWLMAGFMLLWALALLVRMGAAWGEQAERSLWQATPAQTLYLTANALAVLAVTIGMVLLASSRLHREIEYVARHDSLTQALTRRAFIDACEIELDRCRRHHRDMALLMLDIDHFKSINDARGHQVGDDVLLDFASRIGALLRRSDQFGRYGGEEFVVLLPETGPREALVVAERIRARSASLQPGLPGYTVSVGVTVNLPGEDRIDTLLKRADTALYQAKAGGRDRVVFV